MKRALRFAVLVGILAITALLPAPNAQAAGTCRIWCDNGITVEGSSDSYQDCLNSFLGNCSQWGWYGGTFCYDGYPCQTV